MTSTASPTTTEVLAELIGEVAKRPQLKIGRTFLRQTGFGNVQLAWSQKNRSYCGSIHTGFPLDSWVGVTIRLIREGETIAEATFDNFAFCNLLGLEEWTEETVRVELSGRA